MTPIQHIVLRINHIIDELCATDDTPFTYKSDEYKEYFDCQMALLMQSLQKEYNDFISMPNDITTSPVSSQYIMTLLSRLDKAVEMGEEMISSVWSSPYETSHPPDVPTFVSICRQNDRFRNDIIFNTIVSLIEEIIYTISLYKGERRIDDRRWCILFGEKYGVNADYAIRSIISSKCGFDRQNPKDRERIYFLIDLVMGPQCFPRDDWIFTYFTFKRIQLLKEGLSDNILRQLLDHCMGERCPHFIKNIGPSVSFTTLHTIYKEKDAPYFIISVDIFTRSRLRIYFVTGDSFTIPFLQYYRLFANTKEEKVNVYSNWVKKEYQMVVDKYHQSIN